MAKKLTLLKSDLVQDINSELIGYYYANEYIMIRDYNYPLNRTYDTEFLLANAAILILF